MEKLFNPYDKEYMKMAMLKHEETFREQVYELHRLYQIQKLLMKNISSIRNHSQEFDRRNIKIVTKSNQANDHHQDMQHKGLQRQGLDLEIPAQDYIPGVEGNGMTQIDDESELELTLGLGPMGKCRRRKSMETSLPSDSALSFSSSSTGSSNIKRTNVKWGSELPGASNPSVLGARKNSSNIQEQLRQDIHSNPPWFLQALSLSTS